MPAAGLVTVAREYHAQTGWHFSGPTSGASAEVISFGSIWPYRGIVATQSEKTEVLTSRLNKNLSKLGSEILRDFSIVRYREAWKEGICQMTQYTFY